jgi:hypothetical protein
MAEDDVLSRVAAAWRASGLTSTRQRSDRPVRAPRRADGLLDHNEATDAAAQSVSLGAQAATNYGAYTEDANGDTQLVPQNNPDLYVTTMRKAGTPVPRDSSYWNLRDNETPEEVNAAARLTTSSPASDPVLERSAAAWNQALRHELTPEEWARLTTQQQDQVRFNNQLLTAYDADMAEGSIGRRNTEALISQLQLGPERADELNARLGLGVGPATRYSDLFGSGTGEEPRRPTQTDSSRRELIASISGEISSYIRQLQNGGADATAAASQYQFDNEQARTDYEYSFDAMLNPANLSTTSWSTMQQNLTAAGYNPDDFKSYILDRVKLLPMTEGQSSAEDIQSWFG